MSLISYMRSGIIQAPSAIHALRMMWDRHLKDERKFQLCQKMSIPIDIPCPVTEPPYYKYSVDMAFTNRIRSLWTIAKQNPMDISNKLTKAVKCSDETFNKYLTWRSEWKNGEGEHKVFYVYKKSDNGIGFDFLYAEDMVIARAIYLAAEEGYWMYEPVPEELEKGEIPVRPINRNTEGVAQTSSDGIDGLFDMVYVLDCLFKGIRPDDDTVDKVKRMIDVILRRGEV